MLIFHRPNSFIVGQRIIFSNIRFIGTQILLTGCVVLDDIDNLALYSNMILNVNGSRKEFRIVERRKYEPSLICIAEDFSWRDMEKIQIEICMSSNTVDGGQDKISMRIEKEHYDKYLLAAMTLFKYDYRLMELYVDYYSNMGVECFYFYFNGKISENMFDFMKGYNVPIHVMEWDYPYWIEKTTQSTVQHNAQVMAIMDSLYLMKHMTKYCLYNDFDEYIFPSTLKLTDLVQIYPNVNDFNFFCHWASIGQDLVSYENTKEKFYSEKLIINRNHCGFERRKSLVKVEDVRIMRIHFPCEVEKHNQLQISGFAHICNFEKMNRTSMINTSLTSVPVAVSLNAGLGNRLFQIAFIYAYSKRNKKVEFGFYNCEPNPHSQIDYHKTVYPFMKKIDLGSNFKIVQEKQTECISYVQKPDTSEPTLFVGYFQCEKYFKEYRKDLITLFQFPDLQMERLRNPSMFIHVRRGDYVNNVNHDVNLFLYYHKALRLFKDKFNKFTLFVISDDIKYCIDYKLFQSYHDDVVYVSDLNELETIALMKKCSLGGVCSNSSFSWWGSYLNESPDKMVIFPSQWFANSFYQSFPKDIYFEKSFVMDIKTFEVRSII